jgi:hypothetical protein
MLQTFLPSVLRPDSSHDAIFEIPQLNILSYIYPVYLDIGFFGVQLFTAMVAIFTASAHKHALGSRRFGVIATYAFLFYSAILSFFTAFWLYLPAVFQIAFFFIFQRMFFKTNGCSDDLKKTLHQKDGQPANLVTPIPHGKLNSQN